MRKRTIDFVGIVCCVIAVGMACVLCGCGDSSVIRAENIEKPAQSVAKEAEPVKVKSEVAYGSYKDADKFIGDWSAQVETDYGDYLQNSVQIIGLGDGMYKLNLLEEFDSRAEPVAVLDAKLDGNQVTFKGDGLQWTGTGKGVVDGDLFTGRFEGTDSGKFKMKRIERISPTLGAKAPQGAVVLFDGDVLDQWLPIGQKAGIVDFLKFMKGDDSAAYLRNNIWSEKAQEAVLELGSDDGVKVWLNGELVHANNVMRGVQPGQDKVGINLKKQWNEILVKIINGSGGWGASVRLADKDGKRLTGVSEMVSVVSSDTGSDKYLKKNNGFLTLWSMAGPYNVEGKGAGEIFDVKLGPERGDSAVNWKRVNLNSDNKVARWRLVDGSMEVKGGSIITKKQFKDIKRLHVEFRTPYMPKARGQGRGNSGVYILGRYEVQVLDSYGLEGVDNECGGIYKVGTPLVNMCAPPTQWQTYDISFKTPRFDQSGNKLSNAFLTVIHNGVAIHENLEIPGPTGGAVGSNENQAGGIYLQDHGNPVQYRNIWVVE